MLKITKHPNTVDKYTILLIYFHLLLLINPNSTLQQYWLNIQLHIINTVVCPLNIISPHVKCCPGSIINKYALYNIIEIVGSILNLSGWFWHTGDASGRVVIITVYALNIFKNPNIKHTLLMIKNLLGCSNIKNIVILLIINRSWSGSV